MQIVFWRRCWAAALLVCSSASPCSLPDGFQRSPARGRQVVMEGFMRWRLLPVGRRLLTRGLAILPAVAVP